MKEFIGQSVFFGVFITLITYELGTWIRKKTKLAICNPMLISIIAVILFLLTFKIDYTVYYEGAKYISYLLTPATVALAVPLYEQFSKLKENALAIVAGLVAGVLTSLCSIFVMCKLAEMSHELYVTLLPKSITTAIGMGISEELGGVVTITIAVIVITGIIGNVFAEAVCRLFHITDPVAKGIGIGSASHALGTAKAMELGEVEGAMSSLSIAVAGILTVVGASIFANFM
ncbi:MAG: LrgB family protein [Lachnospiraceae bacterium]